MRNLVIGGDSKLGRRLADYLGAPSTTRRDLGHFEKPEIFYDLSKSSPMTLPLADVIYLCAAETRFRICEIDFDTYRINVDANIAIAGHFKKAHIVYISSEAAQWNQTSYGAQKRACELGLLAACGYERLCVVRPNRIAPETMDDLCDFLKRKGNMRAAGTYIWKSEDVVRQEKAA